MTGQQFDWEHIVYRFRDRQGALLYVGLTNDTKRRFAQHAKDSKWWPQVATCQTEFHPTREAAADAEHKAIHDEFPLYNERLTRSVHPVPGAPRKARAAKATRATSPTPAVLVLQFNPDMPKTADMVWAGDGMWRGPDGQAYPSYVLAPAPMPQPGMDVVAYRRELLARGATEEQAAAAAAQFHPTALAYVGT